MIEARLMGVEDHQLFVKTTSDTDIIDITPLVRKEIEKLGYKISDNPEGYVIS